MGRRWEPMLEQVVRERYPALVATARLLVGDHAAAEDLVQDALVATFGSRARFGSAAQAEQYVRRAIATRAVDRARRRGRERAALSRVAAASAQQMPGPEPSGRETLVAALATLAPQQRACVVMRFVSDLSVRDTAAALGISEGAVKRYVSDGIRALDGLLGTRTDDLDAVEIGEVGLGA